VKPGSAKPGFSFENGAIVLRVRERAIDGAANDACVRALAGVLGVARTRVTLVRGQRARTKVFAIDGMNSEQARSLLPLKPSH